MISTKKIWTLLRKVCLICCSTYPTLKMYLLPCVVAINAFPTDTEEELTLVEEKCRQMGVNAVISEVWAKGGEGGAALAEEVVRLCQIPGDFRQSYDLSLSIEEKLNAICKSVYHADGAVLTDNAKKQAKKLEDLGFGNLPICVAKTQYSFSDDPSKLGAPSGFTVTVRNLKVSGRRRLYSSSYRRHNDYAGSSESSGG